ncbi:response regulator [Egbenema bharatensis]|uniref:response regulator n=1 Tax=Egbenema bharatensis TaxID=3463334 RepID=UPI003A83DFBE
MAINPEIRDQAYQFFIEEAPDLLQTLEAGLLTLSQDRSTAKIHNLMRSAHSIKGGAASVGLDAIATLSHRLENIFKALYNEALEIDTELENQLLGAFDCLRLPLMEQITTGFFNAEQALHQAEPILAQIEERCGDALLQESYIPSSSELGIDIVASIFEVDVAQGLERLAVVVAEPHNYEVMGELQAQVEVFAGFAEFLNIPRFSATAEAVRQAMQNYPHQALEITQLAISEFEQCRQAVLAGDRAGEPNLSVELLSLSNPSVDEFASTDPVDPPDPTDSNPVLNELNQAFPFLETIFGDPTVTQTESHDPAFIDAEASIIETDFYETSDEIVEEFENYIGSVSEAELEDNSFSQAYPSDPYFSQHRDQLIDYGTEYEQNFSTSKIVPLHQLRELSSASESTHRSEPFYTQKVESPVTPNLTIRVDSDRLERMNNLVGELMINRDGLSLQNEQLHGVLKGLVDRFDRFRMLIDRFQELANQTLISPTARQALSSLNPNAAEALNATLPFPGKSAIEDFSATPTYPVDATALVEFDALEMDSYGALYLQMQEIQENLVQLEESIEDITLFTRQSNRTLDQQRQSLTYLQDELKWARMLPLGELLNRFPRVLRDLSTTYSKPVRLTLAGTDTLVDKAMLEKLYDPLLHLLRNAFDHGIEPPFLRRQRGKPEQGHIEIRAYHKGNQTIIEIKDDGQGLNVDRIRSRAFEMGWLAADQLLMTTPDQLFELIFEPGFSTATQVSELSGRGVGLDVVRSQLAAIKGSVSVTSTLGKETTFTLYLPLTLTIARLMIGLVGSSAFAIPAEGIEEILTPQPNQLKQSGNQQFLYWREQIIPAYSLTNLLDYSCPLPEIPMSKALISVSSPEEWAAPILIMRQDQRFIALQVDRLVNEQELVVKPFSPTIAPPSYTYGCTILGDGSLVPVLDILALLEFKQSQGASPPQTISASNKPESWNHRALLTGKTIQAPTILVVDDAVTLRRTLALSLERQGFRILQARDGWEAIDQLKQSSSIKLIICDVEMPNMNGFEFLSYRRQNPQFSDIPVVMLTSRSNDKHRWLATQLGATAYFTKPYLEQDFLNAIKTILQSDNDAEA